MAETNGNGNGTNGTFQKTVDSLMKGMDGFVSSKTVVGEPIYIEDTILL
ncbi:MAG: sporulation protein, partial [Clostridiales bacterium]|nr:sporulation protein [Clostridiales bacterium]